MSDLPTAITSRLVVSWVLFVCIEYTLFGRSGLPGDGLSGLGFIYPGLVAPLASVLFVSVGSTLLGWFGLSGVGVSGLMMGSIPPGLVVPPLVPVLFVGTGVSTIGLSGRSGGCGLGFTG